MRKKLSKRAGRKMAYKGARVSKLNSMRRRKMEKGGSFL